MRGGSEMGPGPFPRMLMCWGVKPLSQESLLVDLVASMVTTGGSKSCYPDTT